MVTCRSPKPYVAGSSPAAPAKLWIEGYSCGCSVGPVKKKDLLGYCATHGNNWNERYKIDGSHKVDQT